MGKINKIILSEIHKLNEYITRDVVSLYKYFNLSDDEKKRLLVYEFTYLFPDYLDDNDLPSDILKNFGERFNTYQEVAEWLENTQKEYFNGFGDYLFRKTGEFDLGIPHREYPTWAFFQNQQY